MGKQCLIAAIKQCVIFKMCTQQTQSQNKQYVHTQCCTLIKQCALINQCGACVTMFVRTHISQFNLCWSVLCHQLSAGPESTIQVGFSLICVRSETCMCPHIHTHTQTHMHAHTFMMG